MSLRARRRHRAYPPRHHRPRFLRTSGNRLHLSMRSEGWAKNFKKSAGQSPVNDVIGPVIMLRTVRRINGEELRSAALRHPRECEIYHRRARKSRISQAAEKMLELIARRYPVF